MKCKECKAFCCLINRIRIQWRDIQNISKNMGLTIKEFIEEYTNFELPKKYYEGWIVPVAEVKYQNIDGFSYCIFIDPRNYKCKIHDFKPEGCRNFKCGKYENDV